MSIWDGKPMEERGPFRPPPSTGDPNSNVAAAAIEPVAGTKRAAVLDMLRTCGPMAEWELERELAWPGNTVRPRLWELELAGYIEKHGRTLTPAGRPSWLYRVRELTA